MPFSKQEYRARIEAAQGKLGARDALLISKDANVRYFTGVDSGRILIWKGGARYWLNEVYAARANRSPITPEPQKKDAIKNFILSKKFKRVGVDPVELAYYNALDAKMRRLVKPSDICEELRKIKSPAEMGAIKKAGEIASDAMQKALGMDLRGMTEIELAAQIEYEIRRRGSERPPFNNGMLCLSGPNAGFPHAPSTERKILEGDLVILDLGAVYDGYHSDMTRTVRVGDVPAAKRKVADFIDALEYRAIDLIKPGGKISGIHNFVEKEIGKKGYKFAHLTGHGVGLDIHERPSVGPDEKDVFRDGMVFTIEPGIYTKSFGVRSEDTLAMVKGKLKFITG